MFLSVDLQCCLGITFKRCEVGLPQNRSQVLHLHAYLPTYLSATPTTPLGTFSGHDAQPGPTWTPPCHLFSTSVKTPSFLDVNVRSAVLMTYSREPSEPLMEAITDMMKDFPKDEAHLLSEETQNCSEICSESTEYGQNSSTCLLAKYNFYLGLLVVHVWSHVLAHSEQIQWPALPNQVFITSVTWGSESSSMRHPLPFQL